ncbi:NYN domain-containing protein [Orrella sp. JC864]
MAVFCDFENVALGVRDAKYEKFDMRPILERLLLKGSIVVKKAYCDWDRYKAFKNAMHEANFELIEIPHVRQSGKNSADIRLVVDALDLCYTKSHVDTFVIVSGDSDFSPLVSKLRENAKQVIGVGIKQSTSDLLIANCDEFIFYDDLVREQVRKAARKQAQDNGGQNGARRDEDKRRKEDVEARRSQAIEIAVETFEALASERGDTGKIWASMLKEAIKRRKPDFNESYYGFRAFGNLLEEAQARGLLQFGRDEKSGAYVYREAGSTPPAAADNGAAREAAPAREKDSERGRRRNRDRGADRGPAEATGGAPAAAGAPAPASVDAPVPAAPVPAMPAAGTDPQPPAAGPASPGEKKRRSRRKGELALPAETPEPGAPPAAAAMDPEPPAEPAAAPAKRARKRAAKTATSRSRASAKTADEG